MNIEQGEKKKIAITGAAGFIGSHLSDALLERGHSVVAIDNLSMGTRRNLEHNLAHPRFTFFEEDVRNKEYLYDICADCNAIVHLAAFKIPRYDPALDTLQINHDGTRNVLDIAKVTRCKVVFASTSDVYGKNPQLPFSEDGNLVIGPSNVKRWSYAVSKLHDEHLCFAYQEMYDFPVVILRFFGSYGPRHNMTWWGGPQSVFINKVYSGEEIEIHGNGMQTRSFTYVADTVKGIVAAVEKPEANGEIFNLGSTHEITILELARLVNRLMGREEPFPMKYIPYKSFSGGKYEDVMRRVPDVSKAQRILGIVADTTLEEGLRTTIDWHVSMLEKENQLVPAIA
ncbi:MAG: NAD-dependent epimerase/dehydratase family protein [Chloroflexota bacterium]